MPIRTICFLVALFLILFGVFYLFPQIDITVSQLFFESERGFPFARHSYLLIIHYGIPMLTKTLLAAYVLLLLIWVLFRWHPKFLPPLVTLYLLVAFAVGPGLVVAILKAGTGRARPDIVTVFNGSKEFSKPFEISHECQRNCSFTSGHTAVGFYLLTFSLLARRYRKSVFTAAFTFGCIVALSRVIMGRHFLSDVIFSGYFIYVTSFMLYYFVFCLHRCFPYMENTENAYTAKL